MKKLLLTFVLLLLFVGCGHFDPYYYEPYVQGNCVDSAIRIKQDLDAQNYETQIVFGMVHKGTEEVGHAWVKYRDKTSGEWKILKNY